MILKKYSYALFCSTSPLAILAKAYYVIGVREERKWQETDTEPSTGAAR